MADPVAQHAAQDRRAQQIAAVHDLLDSAGYLIRDADPICAELVDAVEAVPRIPADQVGAYEARGYQQAIANLLDTAGYKRWHRQVYATTGVDHHRWNFNNRVTLADYLEAVAPGQPGAPDGATS